MTTGPRKRVLVTGGAGAIGLTASVRSISRPVPAGMLALVAVVDSTLPRCALQPGATVIVYFTQVVATPSARRKCPSWS